MLNLNNRKIADWEEAWLWLIKRRRQAPPNADIWHLRFHWQKQRVLIFEKVVGNAYCLSPMRVFGRYAQWDACDALVLKWVALQITPSLPVHPLCGHVRGHGGTRGSLLAVAAALADDTCKFVYRTDI